MFDLTALLRDTIWAKAMVLWQASYRLDVAWPVLWELRELYPPPPRVGGAPWRPGKFQQIYDEDHYRISVFIEDDPVLRSICLDGDLHYTDGRCGCRDLCCECGSRSHVQGAYGCLLRACEDCDLDEFSVVSSVQ